MSTDPAPEIENFSVADVAVNYPQAIRILNRCRLDYCCNGKIPFVKACEDLNLNPYTIWKHIEEEIRMIGANHRRVFKNLETSALIDFILQHHHEYLRRAIPQIKNLLETVCNVHHEEPELQDVKQHFEALAEDLVNHIPREEDVLFPALRRLSRQNITDLPILDPVQKTISVIEHEHSRTGDLIRAIRRLTYDYTAPPHACPTFQLLFNLLEEFEWDLMQHIHLENNILFPKVKDNCKTK